MSATSGLPTIGVEEEFLLVDPDSGEPVARNAAVAQIAENRATIEQAKGMLMLIYNIPADRAFDILRWRSQHTNINSGRSANNSSRSWCSSP